jgi:hypothetical protein
MEDVLGGNVACMREMINAFKVLIGKLEGNIPPRRPLHR